MPYDDVLRIRDASQAYRFAERSREEALKAGRREPGSWTEAPWVKYEVAMARKTVFRAASKWLPRSVELASAIALDEAADRRRSMDFGSVLDAREIDGTADYLGAAVEASEQPEDETAIDPGAAFGIRQNTEQKPSQDVARRTTTGAASFEAALVDQNGELVDEPFTDPIRYVKAVIEVWRRASEPDQAIILDNNADAIEDIRAHHQEAAKFLNALEVKDQGGDTVPQTIEPETENGKVQWSRYVRALKSAITSVPLNLLEGWVEHQKEFLARAPISQRVPAIRAIADAFTSQGIQAPSWLHGLLAPPKTAQEASTEPDPTIKPIEAVDTRTSDERWVDDTIRDLEAIGDMNYFNLQTKAAATQTRMVRLQRDNPALFERARKAFDDKYQSLSGNSPQEG
jgi:hypothetical protein